MDSPRASSLKKIRRWMSRPSIQDSQDESIPIVGEAQRIKTKMQTLPIIRGRTTRSTRSTRRSREIEEGQQSFTPYGDATERWRTEQEERAPFGSEYVVLSGDTYSGSLDTERINKLLELNDRCHRGPKIPPADSKHSTTSESGLEGVDSSSASHFPHQRPSTSLVAEPLNQSYEGSPDVVCDLDDLASWGAEKQELLLGTPSIQIENDTSTSQRREILQWLSHTDPSSNHNMACQKRLASTGCWLLNTPAYSNWLSTPNSMLWCHGIPGSGKTILCSTVIDDLHAHIDECGDTSLAYFYVDFNDVEKQRPRNLLCSIIAQLASKLSYIPDPLNAMHRLFQNSQPPLHCLKGVLLSILQHCIETFLVIDALDECPRGSEREEMLALLKEVSSWSLANLHILITSRRERDIENVVLNLSTSIVCIQTPELDADITSYIRDQLTTHPRLKRWPQDVKNEIETRLISGANGMFRWVSCQVEALERCINATSIRNTLNSFPKTLDKTYARIILAIEENYQEEALRALSWILVSKRPLRIEELAEALAIDPEGDPPFDPKKRLFDPHDVLYILSSLVYISGSEGRGNQRSSKTPQEAEVVRVVHHSVKEYLISNRIQHRGPTSIFSMTTLSAHDLIAESCAAYIMSYCQVEKKTLSEEFEKFPLLEYACQHWYTHAQVTLNKTQKSPSSSTHKLMLSSTAFSTWLRIHQPDYPSKPPFAEMDTTGSPLYYACFLGLFAIIDHLLASGAEINAQGGHYGTALQAASVQGHNMVVLLLLERGADINAQGGHYGTALQAASVQGHNMVVLLLLDRGADINAQGGHHGTALQAASVQGHNMVVLLLLERGADINAQGGHYGTALQAASVKGQEVVVQLLIDQGADSNAQGGYYGNALVGASRGGNASVVRYLIQHGANIAATGCYGQTVLQRMREGGAEVTREDLDRQSASSEETPAGLDAEEWQPLDKSVDTESRYNSKATALHVAVAYRQEAAFQQLLLDGASCTAEDSNKWTALHWAAESGLDAVVVLLLRVGAKIESRDREGRSPLSWAAGCGQETTVKLLLRHGAEINSEDVEGQTPFSWAAARGHSAIVALLLEHGATIESKDGEGQTALSWAAWNGHQAVVKILLNLGADVESKDCTGRTPLFWAVEDGHGAVVKLLLGTHANVNARDTTDGRTPLSMASKQGHKAVVKLLLDAGAKADANDAPSQVAFVNL